jgi:hypothetical protein
MINNEIRQEIIRAMQGAINNYPSASKMAMALGISPSQLSRVMKGNTEGILSDANWISIARRLDVHFGERTEIVAAETDTYRYITTQLGECQQKGVSLMLCDRAGIGKTFAARRYVRTHANAVYIDCSQAKTRQRLVRAIAREFGINSLGVYADVYNDLVYYLRSIPNPLVVLDEAGDLTYEATLELKALWNATEFTCGWYMMGADGLRAKFERFRRNQKVGFAELFRRYGERYQRITPDSQAAYDEFARRQVAIVAKANGLGNVQELAVRTGGSLTRLYLEMQKLKSLQA